MEVKKRQSGVGDAQWNNDNIIKALVVVGGALVLLGLLYVFFSSSRALPKQSHEEGTQTVVHGEDLPLTAATQLKEASINREGMVEETRWGALTVTSMVLTYFTICLYGFNYFGNPGGALNHPMKFTIDSILAWFAFFAACECTYWFFNFCNQQEETESTSSSFTLAWLNLCADNVRKYLPVTLTLATIANLALYGLLGFWKIVKNWKVEQDKNPWLHEWCYPQIGDIGCSIVRHGGALLVVFALWMANVYLFSKAKLIGSPNFLTRLVERKEEVPAAEKEEESVTPNREEDGYSLPEETQTNDSQQGGLHEDEDANEDNSKEEASYENQLQEEEEVTAESDEDDDEEEDE